MDTLPAAGELRTLAEILALDELLPLAWRTALAAGAFLRDERPADLAVQTKSTATDAVTVMDKGAEDLIIGALLGARPGDGFLGEEGGERAGSTGIRWVVDPLDGTINYLYRLPMWGVSIAAEEHGTSRIGIVVAPDLDEAYIGVRGGGAWLVRGERAERLHVRECAAASQAMVVTGFSYRAHVRERQADVVRSLITQVRDIRRLGAAVIDLCWLARGRIDCFYEKYLNRWDIAAGTLIAAEAGAVVDGLTTGATDAFLFACVPGVAEEVRALLAQGGALDA